MNGIDNKLTKICLVIATICLIITTCCLAVMTIKKFNSYDVNNDGEVNSIDYVLIKNYIMNRGDK